MLIERMIQLLQENSILRIVCILLEWKPLPVINPISTIVLLYMGRLLRMLKLRAAC